MNEARELPPSWSDSLSKEAKRKEANNTGASKPKLEMKENLAENISQQEENQEQLFLNPPLSFFFFLTVNYEKLVLSKITLEFLEYGLWIIIS